MLAPTNALENVKVTNVTGDYNDKHFAWIQIVRPRSKLYYTPPEFCLNFPDIDILACNLTLALYDGECYKFAVNFDC